MKLSLTLEDPLRIPTPALVVGCLEEEPGNGLLASLDRELNGVVQRLYAEKEFSGKANTVKIIHTLGKLSAERLVLVGLGKRGELTPERYRKAAGSAVKQLKGARIAAFLSCLQPDGGTEAIQAAVEGYILGAYSFLEYQKKEDPKGEIKEITFPLPKGEKEQEIQRAVREAQIVANAACFARDLVSHPGNTATPAFLAEKARKVAEEGGFACSILDRGQLEEKGMGALVAVGKGSVNPPQMVILEYRGGQPADRPLVLVGKGITFDSGGISLKPREGMEKMKDDMAGGAAVIATFQAVSALRLPVNLVGLVPLAENLPGGAAYKPGDILKSMSGTTIEVVNTDAEGRLILCDALHFARRYEPKAIIDIATLTGACVVALGSFATGMLGNDEPLMKALKEAGERTGERLWQLPLWDEYGELMESDVADLKNAGGTSGATITAAWFLKQFVGETPWVHLDIAATAWEDKGRPYLPKGATGVGVRLFVQLLRDRLLDYLNP